MSLGGPQWICIKIHLQHPFCIYLFCSIGDMGGFAAQPHPFV